MKRKTCQSSTCLITRRAASLCYDIQIKRTLLSRTRGSSRKCPRRDQCQTFCYTYSFNFSVKIKTAAFSSLGKHLLALETFQRFRCREHVSRRRFRRKVFEAAVSSTIARERFRFFGTRISFFSLPFLRNVRFSFAVSRSNGCLAFRGINTRPPTYHTSVDILVVDAFIWAEHRDDAYVPRSREPVDSFFWLTLGARLVSLASVLPVPPCGSSSEFHGIRGARGSDELDGEKVAGGSCRIVEGKNDLVLRSFSFYRVFLSRRAKREK